MPRTWLPGFLLVAGSLASAQTDIHRCVQQDGTVAFQETPCPEPEVAEEAVETATEQAGLPVGNSVDFESPYDSENTEPVMETPPVDLPAELARDRATCEKATRDAIDAIDATLQHSDNAEEDRKHLDELLELTRQLRACKTL
jgi:hypothetical protein